MGGMYQFLFLLWYHLGRRSFFGNVRVEKEREVEEGKDDEDFGHLSFLDLVYKKGVNKIWG